MFVGPSLYGDDLPVSRARFLPPIKQGDLDRLVASDEVDRVLIVDGDFGQSYPVTPLEIVQAIRRGVSVAGSTSMGALRAADLASAGMVGIGGIFGDYMAGRLVGDDEVAVLYDPSSGRPLNVPMVNVRLLLESARESGVDEGETHELLRRLSMLHFRRRTWRSVGSTARNISAAIGDYVEGALSMANRGSWDRKRQDARQALAMFLDEELPQVDLLRGPSPPDWRAFLERGGLQVEHEAQSARVSLESRSEVSGEPF